MMVVCDSRSEINVHESIDVYEFAVVPRSLFAADGPMLRCANKTTLNWLLEYKAPRSTPDGPTVQPVRKKTYK